MYTNLMTTEVEEGPGWKFHFTRIYSYICPAILYAFVSFQKQCPAVVAEDMAAAYKVTTTELSIFSSIYFYPYACMQPFAGLLADIIDPAYVIGVSGLVAACGSIICGLSNTIGVGILGRLLVGLGCGPTYVSTVRIITRWFKTKSFPVMLGILVAMSGAGGMLAAGPLSLFIEKFPWRYGFYGIGGIGAFLALLVLIFVRGDPRKKGFLPVNEESAPIMDEEGCADKMKLLWSNIKTVFSVWYFWPITLFNILSSCPYIDIVGYWGGPYLIDIKGMEKKSIGSILIAISIGMVVGSLTIPTIANLLKMRKWVCTGGSIITLAAILVFCFIGDTIGKTWIFILYLVIGYFTAPLCSVSYPLLTEYYSPTVSASAVGISNFFVFILSAVYQVISSATIPLKGSYKDGKVTRYTWDGYRYGLYVFCAVSIFLSAVVISITKETTAYQPKDESQHQYDQIDGSISSTEKPADSESKL